MTPARVDRYRHACAETRERLGAAGLLLVVIQGHQGSGASFDGDPLVREELPFILRKLADAIENEDAAAGVALARAAAASVIPG